MCTQPGEVISLPILADAADIGAQVAALFDLALTPTGFALIAIGLLVVCSLLVTRFGTEIIGATCIFLLSMMRLDSKFVDNTLVQPLQAIRDYSRPISLALVLLLAMRALAFQRGERLKLLSLPCVIFFGFETYFLLMVGMFADLPRAIFGWVSIFAILIAYVLGLGRLLQPNQTGRAYVRMFLWAGIAFVAANMFQLTLGYSNAILKGRMAGISGNPQQFSATCCVFTIFFSYLFATTRGGSPLKWMGASMIGVMALFVLWSGSRTGALCFTVCLVAYFRTRVGRLAVLVLSVGVVLGLLTSLFSESTFGTDRFLYGSDTRTAVWLGALDEFVKSPLIGGIPVSGDDGMNYSESTYLRTLAMLGVVGGLQLLLVVVLMIGTAWRAWQIGRYRSDLAPIADVVVASTAFTLVVNIFEGFMFGILTYFIIHMYATFAMAIYVADAGESSERIDPLAAEMKVTDGSAG